MGQFTFTTDDSLAKIHKRRGDGPVNDWRWNCADLLGVKFERLLNGNSKFQGSGPLACMMGRTNGETNSGCNTGVMGIGSAKNLTEIVIVGGRKRCHDEKLKTKRQKKSFLNDSPRT